MASFGAFWSGLSRKTRRVVLSLFAVGMLAGGVHLYYASSPRGTYLDPYFDPETFWVFKDGKVYLTTGKGLQYAGPYSRVQGRWVVFKGYVKPSFFGLRWYDPQFNNGGMHFLPRRCFTWFYYKLT